MKPTIYAIAIIAAALTLAWAAAASRMTEPESSIKHIPINLTQTVYDQIEIGMSLEEVTEIFQSKSSETWLYKDGFVKAWQFQNCSLQIIFFDSGRVKNIAPAWLD